MKGTDIVPMNMFVFLLWFKEAINGVFKNFFWNIVVVFLTFLSLMSFSVASLSESNVDNLIDTLNNRLEILVNIKDEKTKYNRYKKKIENMESVTEVTFISSDEAMENFKKEVGEDYTALEIFKDSNPLPAQFVVKTNDPDNISELAAALEKKDFVEDVFFGKEYVEKLLEASEKINHTSTILTYVTTIFVMLVLFFTIKLNIETRKEEMRIKNLIGSSYLTTRMPFFIETLLLTSTGAVLSFFSVKYLYNKLDFLIGKDLPYLELISFNELAPDIAQELILYVLALSFVTNLFITNKKINKKV